LTDAAKIRNYSIMLQSISYFLHLFYKAILLNANYRKRDVNAYSNEIHYKLFHYELLSVSNIHSLGQVAGVCNADKW